jgi:predicted nucleic acid-binding protein
VSAVLFDTTLYVSAFRSADFSTLRQNAAKSTVWLSSVVLEELYAGTSDRDHQDIESLERDFRKARRLVVPLLSDWTQTGKLLASLAVKYGYEPVGRGRLTNDALIACSAGRMGITVITANVRDFRRLSEFQPFQWRVDPE